ncbi:hypothetical protein EX30DRAFT_365999 [Ascodesmis nigricans]|uniref:Uncharacterized protein n=1 Tax=Ascodesmis nigricans TaxID=341454 RepID=A0A4S2MMX8_9PEZI|nr:hypothetical protein EX30DRAFT_365999 [Ascodesmis nigricans]
MTEYWVYYCNPTATHPFAHWKYIPVTTSYQQLPDIRQAYPLYTWSSVTGIHTKVCPHHNFRYLQSLKTFTCYSQHLLLWNADHNVAVVYHKVWPSLYCVTNNDGCLCFSSLWFFILFCLTILLMPPVGIDLVKGLFKLVLLILLHVPQPLASTSIFGSPTIQATPYR